MTQTAVQDGISPTVPLIAGGGFRWPTAEGETLTTEVCLDGPLTAPISAGTTVGAAVFRLDGREVGRVSLIVGRGTELRQGTGQTGRK